MRFLRYLPLAAVVLAGACAKDASVTNVARPPLAFIRYVHAVPDFGPTDFKFIDAVEYSPVYANTTFRTVGIFQGARAGSRRIRVFRNSSNINETQQVLVDTTLTLTAGTYYTIVHSGFANPANGAQPQQLYVIEDNRPDQAAASQHVSVVNAVIGNAVANQDVYICTPTTLTITAGNNQAAVAGGRVITNPAVRVDDNCGYVVGSEPVNFAAVGGGAPGAASVNTGATTGIASTTWRLGTTGAQTLEASTAQIAPVTFNGTIATPATLTIDTPSSSTIIFGGTLQLTATVEDAGANEIGAGGAITWTSDNTDRATVNSSGLVTTVVPDPFDSGDPGPVTITATVGGTVTDNIVLNVAYPPNLVAGVSPVMGSSAPASLRASRAPQTEDFNRTVTVENFGSIVAGSPALVTNVTPLSRSAWIAKSPGRFSLRSANNGSPTLASTGTPLRGVAGTVAADPVDGFDIGGTQFTAFLFPRSVAGSPAPQGTGFGASAMVIAVDRQPARTVPD